MIKQALKPCPFCGTTDLYLYQDGDMEGHSVMGDHKDGCKFSFGGMLGLETEAEAIKEWNTRVGLVAPMPKQNELPNIILKCQCTHKDHMVVIEYDAELDEYIVFMQMDHWMPWWKRFSIAWRYLRGKKAYNCHFTETPVNGDHFRSSVANIIRHSNKT